MSETCPYCNARQPYQPGLAVGQKLVCARCGEAFTLRQLPASTAITSTPPPAPVTPQKPVRANRLVAGIVLGVMAIMAGAGLTSALITVDIRRDHDRELPPRPRRLSDYIAPQPRPAEPTSPWILAGLGYLPPRTGVLACVQVEDLLNSEAGKELRSRPWKLGKVDVSLDEVRGWTGLALEDVDHVLLGVVVRDGAEADLTPPVHLVVRTRKRYDIKRVKEALKAERGREEPTPEGRTRTVYSASIRNLPVSLWLADERTIVVGVFSRLEQVPLRPHEGLKELPGEVQQLMTKRLSAGVPVWLVGHAADWKKTWLPTLVGQFKEVPLLAHIEQVPSFA